MNKFSTILWWVGILVNVAAIGLYVSASFMGDWKIGLRSIAPLGFIVILIWSRKTIISSRETMAQCDQLLRKHEKTR